MLTMPPKQLTLTEGIFVHSELANVEHTSFGKSVPEGGAHKKLESTRQLHAQATDIEASVNSVHTLLKVHSKILRCTLVGDFP